MSTVSRRGLFAAASMAGVVQAVKAQPIPAVAAPAGASEPQIWYALNLDEAAFLENLAEILVPADELSPSGRDLGVAVYIDRQLAGGWGNGARYYRSGPFLEAGPEFGSQSPLVPRDAIKAGIKAAEAGIAAQFKAPFDQLPPAQRVAAAAWLEKNQPAFFAEILALVAEGLFSDPIYGGNRDKKGWAILGYPGLPALYRKDIAIYRGRKFDKPARSIADFS